MGEITIPLSDEAEQVLEKCAIEAARRHLLWESLMAAEHELGCFLETYGPSDIRPSELRAAVEKVRGIADELASAQGD